MATDHKGAGQTSLTKWTRSREPGNRFIRYFGIDVGIVCALEKPEFEAVVGAFGGHAAWAEVSNASIPTFTANLRFRLNAGTKLRIVGTTSTSMGLTAAAIVTTQLLLRFKPRLVAMIGIAAGTRSADRSFGDVLVADPSVDYNSGKLWIRTELGVSNPIHLIGLNPDSVACF